MTSGFTIAQFLFLLILVMPVVLSENYYEILGVSRSATQQQIRKAYKAKAKEWHPDKSDDPNAGDKFAKISEAYEVLSDSKKRREYDVFGQVMPEQNQGSGGGTPWQHPFADMFHQFHNQQQQGPDVLQSLNFREYKLRVESDSHFRVQVILATSPMCFHCLRISHMLSQLLIKLFEHVGGAHSNIAPRAYRFNLERDGALRDELHVHHAPTIMLVVAGRVTYYSSLFITQEEFIQFFQSVFPTRLVLQLGRDEAELPPDHWHWSDNRVRVLLAKPTPRPSLRYLLTAYLHRQRVQALFLNSEKETAWRTKLDNLGLNEEALWVFREKEHVPSAGEKLAQGSLIAGEDMERHVQAQKFLYVPRLESQKLWEQLCPTSSSVGALTACLVLLVNSPYEGARAGAPLDVFRGVARQAIREASAYSVTPGAVVHPQVEGTSLVFAYLDASRQVDFIAQLNLSSAEDVSSCSLVVMLRFLVSGEDTLHYMCHPWRRANSPWYVLRDRAAEDASFSTTIGLTRGGSGDFHAPALMQWLKETLRNVPGRRSMIDAKVPWQRIAFSELEALVDETVESLGWRILAKLLLWANRLWLWFYDLYEEVPLGPLMLTLAWIVSVIFLSWGWRPREPRGRTSPSSSSSKTTHQHESQRPTGSGDAATSRPSSTPSGGTPPKTIPLVALTPVSYDSLVRLAPQGQLTLILCVATSDAQRTQALKERFVASLRPYAQTTMMKAGFLSVEIWWRWLMDIFQAALEYDGLGQLESVTKEGLVSMNTNLQLHPERVCATVLAINGYRLWFSVLYPQAFPLSERRNSSSSEAEEDLSEEDELVTSLGFNGGPTCGGKSAEPVLFERRLQPWLERLWEGTVKRYRVDQWPTNMLAATSES